MNMKNNVKSWEYMLICMDNGVEECVEFESFVELRIFFDEIWHKNWNRGVEIVELLDKNGNSVDYLDFL